MILNLILSPQSYAKIEPILQSCSLTSTIPAHIDYTCIQTIIMLHLYCKDRIFKVELHFSFLYKCETRDGRLWLLEICISVKLTMGEVAVIIPLNMTRSYGSRASKNTYWGCLHYVNWWERTHFSCGRICPVLY